MVLTGKSGFHQRHHALHSYYMMLDPVLLRQLSLLTMSNKLLTHVLQPTIMKDILHLNTNSQVL